LVFFLPFLEHALRSQAQALFVIVPPAVPAGLKGFSAATFCAAAADTPKATGSGHHGKKKTNLF
jgi:hypothetical protein